MFQQRQRQAFLRAQEGVGFGSMAALDQQPAGHSSSSLNDGNAAAAASGKAAAETSQSLPSLNAGGAAAAAQPREEGTQKSLGSLIAEKRDQTRLAIAAGPHTPRSQEVFRRDIKAFEKISALLQYLDLDTDAKKAMIASEAPVKIVVATDAAAGSAKK